MISKHSELVNKQAQDEKGRFASPLSQLIRRRTSPPSSQPVQPRTTRTAPPPSRREDVYRTTCTTPPSCQEASSDPSIVEMWVLAPPPSRQGASSDSSSNYNDECPHGKKVSSYLLLQDSVQLFSMITKCIHSCLDSRVRKEIGFS
jgi:hypothetical protein